MIKAGIFDKMIRNTKVYTTQKKEVKKLLENQVLQGIITDISRIIKEHCSVWSAEGECLATTSQAQNNMADDVRSLLNEAQDMNMRETERGACFVVRYKGDVMYIFAIHNVIDNIGVMGQLCVNQFEHVLHLNDKRVDRNRFFQQLILDNLLLVDVHSQARKMNLEVNVPRIVFVVEQKKKGDSLLLDTMKGVYDNGTKDVVTSVDETHIIYIKTLSKEDTYEDVNRLAKTLVDTLSMEAMVHVRVAYGTIIDELKDVSKCYKEASMALDVGRIFYAHKDVLAYNELGIGRLIYQLPYSLCEMFLKEVFRGDALNQFDKETLATVNAFFENDLNISETARQMYLHRNTLGYRLDKIQKTTGLDVKKFDDALTFKIALMVSDHMKFIKSQE